ncbi:sigma-70 family RNA polymerase sigma factor [Neobacillus terrae]|uniref:sigma-70 family RNA polymerase sigma factor n=1 Tax=Neobacillus terrae TaxID=3034837 RepID=UPI00140D261F|nr:sigma-70 family RNA polymerase sigma factor [Neobacillus terrae]NHM32517.1 sigma-70 family RNA polymerase sigma factor [Neobacillus terrae]
MKASKRKTVRKSDPQNMEICHLNDLYRGLKRYSLFLTKNKWEADDLVQEAVLKAIQSYEPSEISPALLNKIAYHHWIDSIRKRKKETIGLPEDVLAATDDTSRSGSIIDVVKQLITSLTPKQAVIFILKEAFQFKTWEIAERLGTAETAVKAALYRAKKRLEKERTEQLFGWFNNEQERELLFNLLYDSLALQDPEPLINCISVLPSFAEVTKLAKSGRSSSPLNMYCQAA